jgi:hypothetical protein
MHVTYNFNTVPAQKTWNKLLVDVDRRYPLDKKDLLM